MLDAILGTPVRDFARTLAADLLQELGEAARRPEAKFRRKTDQALARADRRIAEFRRGRRLNWLQRSRAANAFLWTLRDGGCAPDYASELSEWFMLRLQAAD